MTSIGCNFGVETRTSAEKFPEGPIERLKNSINKPLSILSVAS